MLVNNTVLALDTSKLPFVFGNQGSPGSLLRQES